jgi:hypothetical protein
MPLDEPACDGGPRAIEFRCAMGRFSQQHDAGVAKPIEQSAESRVVEIGQALASLPQQAGRRPRPRGRS